MSKDLTASYIVTPPTLFFPKDGMSFCVLSRDKTWVDDMIKFLEDALQGTTATIYTNYDSTTDEYWMWTYQQMGISDFVVVDCGSVTEFDKLLALNESDKNTVWWIDTDELEDNFAALLHTSGSKTASDIEEFFAIVTHRM